MSNSILDSSILDKYFKYYDIYLYYKCEIHL